MKHDILKYFVVLFTCIGFSLFGYVGYNEFFASEKIETKLIKPEVRNDLVAKVRQADVTGMNKYFKDGLDPNTRLGSNGTTLLMIAIQKGNVAAVKHLLEAGADPELGDRTGQKPIDVANRLGHKNIISLLQ